MNVFKILSRNDGHIYEPSISSFLAYLLDNDEDHGLSSYLLEEILRIFIKTDNKWFGKYHEGEKLLFEDLNYSVLQEFSVDISDPNTDDEGKKRRDIDIVIEFYDGIESKQFTKYILCIENKIKNSSVDSNRWDRRLQE